MTDDPERTLLTRRGVLKLGAGAGAAAVGLSGTGLPPAVRPVEDAEAGVLLTGAIGFAGAMATMWALREIGVYGSDAPPDGLGPDTLRAYAAKAAKKRRSYNQSTLTDNDNIIGYMPETLFSEGKLAALEAINDGATENEAIDAGQSKAKKQMATIEDNFLRSWQEAAREVVSLWNQYKSHDSLSGSDLGEFKYTSNAGASWSNTEHIDFESTLTTTLRDGTEKTIDSFGLNDGYSDMTPSPGYDSFTASNGSTKVDQKFQIYNPDGNNPTLLNTATDGREGSWNTIWSEMQTTFDDVLNNISVWVSNVYTEIQTGEISPGEYLSGTDLANTIAEDSSRAQAIGDLIAMNVPGDYEHAVEVKLLDDNAKAKGYLFSTDPADKDALSVGTTIDPNATDDSGNDIYGDWYLSFLPASYIREISFYDADYGIQGGLMRFTQDPRVNEDGWKLSGAAEYAITTSYGETARLDPANVTETTDDSGNTVWEADLSSKLENTIANISQVRLVFADPPDEYRTLLLDQPFEILSIQDGDSVQIQQHRDPQTDSNYITEKEWQKILDQQQELIEKYENASSSGGALVDGNLFDDVSVPSVGPIDTVGEWIVVGGGTIVGSIVLGNLSN